MPIIKKKRYAVRNKDREDRVERMTIQEALKENYIGQKITVCGWIRTRRESKGFAFIVISDGSSQETMQLVVAGEVSSKEELHRYNTGAAIKATGVLRESPAKGQKTDFHCRGLSFRHAQVSP